MTRLHIFFILTFSFFFLSTRQISAVSSNFFRLPWRNRKSKSEDENFPLNVPEEAIRNDEDSVDDEDIVDNDDEETLPEQHQSSRTPLIRGESNYGWQSYPDPSKLISPTPFPSYWGHDSPNYFNPEQNQGENGLLRPIASSSVPQPVTSPAPLPVYIPYPIPSPSTPSCGSCGSPVTVVSLPSNEVASSKCQCCCDTSETKPESTSKSDKTAEDIENIQKNKYEDNEEESTENEDTSDLSADDENVDTSD